MTARLPQSKTQVIKETENLAKGTFTITPLEPGYGITIGNSLRRILHSSIKGYAITHIKIPGILHEYDSIEGILEDVSEIILNLKQVRFKKINDYQDEEINIQIKGNESFNAGDIAKFTSAFEVLNPELTICRIDPSVDLNLTIVLKEGKGYLPAEQNPSENPELGYIPIDAVFAPIKKVAYNVQSVLVGQRTDFEKLVLNIETDGSITAEEALQQSAQTLTRYFSLLFDSKAVIEEQEREEPPSDREFLRMKQLLNTPISDTEIPQRIYKNLTSDSGVTPTLGQIVQLTHKDLMKRRLIGKKSMKDLLQVLESKGLTLGMDVQKYMIKPKFKQE